MNFFSNCLVCMFLLGCSSPIVEFDDNETVNTQVNVSIESESLNSPSPSFKEITMSVPYRFRVNISVEDIAASIKINDIAALANFNGHQIDTIIPVSSFILPGRNALGASVFTDDPSYGPRPRLKAILEAQPFEVSIEGEWFEVSRLEFTGKLTPAPEVTAAEKSPISATQELTVNFNTRTDIGRINQHFSIAADMPEWAWAASKTMDKESPELESLRQTYIDYYKLFQALNPESGRRTSALVEIRRRLDPMLTELGASYGISADEAFFNMGVEDTTKDPTYTLMPLSNPKKWKRAFHANGRLVEFYPQDRDNIFTYEFEGGGLYSSFPWKFRYDGQKWIPTR